MKIINHVSMTLPAIGGNEGFARAAVAAFCAPLSPTIEEINDVKTAVSEAVTNVIVHAYPGDVGDIMLEVILYEDRVIDIKIGDQGVGMEDVEEAKKPFFTTRSAEEHSGMGFTIMEAFTDSLEIRSEKGNGTTVTMRKKFGQNA